MGEVSYCSGNIDIISYRENFKGANPYLCIFNSGTKFQGKGRTPLKDCMQILVAQHGRKH